jgi:hypothetical protein
VLWGVGQAAIETELTHLSLTNSTGTGYPLYYNRIMLGMEMASNAIYRRSKDEDRLSN